MNDNKNRVNMTEKERGPIGRLACSAAVLLLLSTTLGSASTAVPSPPAKCVEHHSADAQNVGASVACADCNSGPFALCDADVAAYTHVCVDAKGYFIGFEVGSIDACVDVAGAAFASMATIDIVGHEEGYAEAGVGRAENCEIKGLWPPSLTCDVAMDSPGFASCDRNQSIIMPAPTPPGVEIVPPGSVRSCAGSVGAGAGTPNSGIVCLHAMAWARSNDATGHLTVPTAEVGNCKDKVCYPECNDLTRDEVPPGLLDELERAALQAAKADLDALTQDWDSPGLTDARTALEERLLASISSAFTPELVVTISRA